ncbi:hypothetical protein LTR37_020547 [Vermiconidia calcicola]|uniref:Uncharacterized protein n=1 Tax=Vermiconidia calcicola TaxID=1690605 RepID=A0ACC3MCS0_9PEZI|nr:hypothetical protein LTR37_020547 [Vermiconidia calcicola]
MDTDNAMERLQNLQRDLIAFTESRLPALDRLAAELDASTEDLRKLLEKEKTNEESRKRLEPPTTPKPTTLKIENEEYRITEDFRATALQVADELDLDEIQAAKLCIDAGSAVEGQADTTIPYRALLQFHKQRFVLLDCVRVLLLQTIDVDAGEKHAEGFQELARSVIRGADGRPEGGSTYWRKCLAAFTEVEGYIKKVYAHRETRAMTGLPAYGEIEDALVAQRLLLIRQHECLAAIMSYLIRGGHVMREDFRSLLTQATQLGEGTAVDVTIHYLPILISGSAHFGSNDATTLEAAKELHGLFTPGPASLQWKQAAFKAAATVCWLAEYSSRFLDPTSAQTLRVADRQKEEEDRSKLLFECLKDTAFHFMLAACQFLKPEVWHDPAKVGMVRFLLEDTPSVPSEKITPPSEVFISFAMSELQSFSDAFVAHLPDVLRRLKADEDDRRRAMFSGAPEPNQRGQLDLERFLVIMSYAYQDNPDAAQDFWSDKESSLYGFLRWISRRLPTPRVAAFCELLRAIASDDKSGNQAHQFLREDTAMVSGKLRKSYSVSWAQIFSELELYASSIKNKPANPQQLYGPDGKMPESDYMEPETAIMLEAYLRLAAHVCRVSPDARNWILREQTFHLGENLFQLASTGNIGRVHAVCFDLLAALLSDKQSEVSEGMWALLDNWISGGGAAGQNIPRLGRHAHPERQYLNNYANNPETAAGLVALLNALVAPSRSQGDLTLDSLPFPENLGAQSRHGGIETYVDFILGTVFRSTGSNEVLSDPDQVPYDVLRCACLNFVCICLSTFNEDLVALANTTNVGVDAAMRTSSLAAYARLHPFARVMDWMLNNNVIVGLSYVVQQNNDDLNGLDPGSPRVQATLRGVQAMNLAMKLQATYFDIVRPLVNKGGQSRTPSVANSSLASYDEVILSQLDVVVTITSFAASNNVDLSFESLSLLQKLCKSRKLGDAAQHNEHGRVRLGSRLVGKLSEYSDAIAASLQPYFEVFEWDVEMGEQPYKLVKATAILDVLNGSLDNSAGRPSVAHCLLGFACHLRSVIIEPGSAFSQGESLFHNIAICAAQAPWAIDTSNISWLVGLKRGCLDVVLKLALSPLTASLVLPELRAMGFLGAASLNEIPALANPLWDQKPLQDSNLLLDSSALTVRDFLHTRESFFEYAALELRSVNESRSYSVQEQVVGALLGSIKLPDGEQIPTNSLFELFDFFDLETTAPSDAACRYFKDLDFSTCLKDDPEIVTSFDTRMAEQLLILRKREMINAGIVKDTHEDAQVDDEIRAILASLTSQNNWRAIQNARISALEAWADLLSLVVTTNSLDADRVASVALQGLQVVLPRLERALSESLDAAALLAKLTLTLVPAATSKSKNESARSVGLAQERLLSAFRVCLKVNADSGTGLALRDVCYRICCAVLTSLPLMVVNGKPSPSANARQLLQLVQSAGERLITIITEDAFSGRGITRVSSLLFLDALVSLFQLSNVNIAMLRALTKLNFIPVLIDSSIGSVTSSFQGDNEELVTTLAYFHTALSLLLRICQTPDGTQLVLNSGFFAAVAESKLFSTDPDIGLDIDNPVALREFYKLLSAVLRVVTAVVMSRGPSNASVLQQAKAFLQQNRFSMQAVFKRTSAVQKTAGPPEKEAVEVAEEFGKVLLVTGFLEDDEPAHVRASRVNGFT